MNELLADLSLIGDEEEELIFDSTSFDHPTEGQNLVLVGCVLTDRNVNFKAMKNILADLWRPVRGVHISEIGDNRLLFQFFHQMDLERILEGGPWTFDNQFIILHHLQEGELPMHVPLFSLNFWVQIYGLPIGYFSESIGKQPGAFLGTLLEYDDTNNSGAWRTYMRIRVAIDVRQSLKRCKKIKKAGCDWIIVQFKYEKLGSFCFVCGCLGHTERFC
ncbi:uncharacterized protein At4g02000-like [Primulina tabacum]|uniref:uncharacterized protein At4g02000-like n=1 Tax=Primulina tabacum TaxID=48773 RepID=UPI003F594724